MSFHPNPKRDGAGRVALLLLLLALAYLIPRAFVPALVTGIHAHSTGEHPHD